MNQPLDKIVNAVLYEGYILYPYRPAVKNRQRWTFGGLYPRAYSEAQGGSDAWTMQTECLVRGDESTTLNVKARCLQLSARLVGELHAPRVALADDEEPPMRLVDSLLVGEQLIQTWQEAQERETALVPWRLGAEPCSHAFSFAGSRRREPLRNPAGDIIGLLMREQEAIAGTLHVSAQRAADGLYRVRVRIENRTALDDAGARSRDQALMRSLVALHIILGVERGEFISLLDPPDAARALAEQCQNTGWWPVLVGDAGQRDTMLAAPIILYDYPQIAGESPGDLFDATEIDEILSLRILTLSDDEKHQAASLDERVRALLDRTETLDRAQFAGLHGAMRPLQPVSREELS